MCPLSLHFIKPEIVLSKTYSHYLFLKIYLVFTYFMCVCGPVCVFINFYKNVFLVCSTFFKQNPSTSLISSSFKSILYQVVSPWMSMYLGVYAPWCIYIFVCFTLHNILLKYTHRKVQKHKMQLNEWWQSKHIMWPLPRLRNIEY